MPGIRGLVEVLMNRPINDYISCTVEYVIQYIGLIHGSLYGAVQAVNGCPE